MVVTNWWHKSRVWIRTRFGVDAGNSTCRSPSARRIGCVCRAQVAPARKKNDPVLETDLLAMVTPETAGDPMRPRKWVRSSLRQLRQRLADVGHAVSAPTVSRLLQQHDYALRVNAKEKEAGSQHPDRDMQFQYIEAQKQAFAGAGQPIISVDTKKKELIGDFKNAGQVWCQQSIEVNVHDFPSDALARAVPYGIYDPRRNHGAVYVGTSADTPEFAVTAIAQWWEQIGRVVYPQATQLLILGDAGGSNGYRPRLWKAQLQSQLSDGLGLRVTVCHYPTGCSKWNPIEHRLFSQISLNWAGQPLRTLETMLGYLHDTTTTTGLQVTATLLEGIYQTGKKVTDAVMKTLEVAHHAICPQWNYTIRPRVGSALRT
jgi:Rhodopirellula transposase DDE domain